MSTVVARSDLAHSILSVYGIITVASAVIGTLVFVVLGWIGLRFRERPGAGLRGVFRGANPADVTKMDELVTLIVNEQ